MKSHAALFMSFAILLAACSKEVTVAEKPQEPGPNAVGFYCRMNLAEHQGPKGQVLLKGWKDPLWFSSVRDALTYAQSEVVSEKEIAAFWVNDMAKGTWEKPAPGSWVEAKIAHYVVGSAKSSGMGGIEAVPFRELNAAKDFARLNGGSVADYSGALHSIAEAEQVSRAGDGT